MNSYRRVGEPVDRIPKPYQFAPAVKSPKTPPGEHAGPSGRFERTVIYTVTWQSVFKREMRQENWKGMNDAAKILRSL